MTEVNETAKAILAADREATEKSREEYMERTKGKPTPTQEECDLAMVGAAPTEHEDDGSGPDPHLTRQVEAKKPAQSSGYATRASAPRHTPTPSHSRAE